MAKGKSGCKRKRTTQAKKQEGLIRESHLNTGWNLDWYKPEGRQWDIIDSINDNDLTIVNAPSGTGKSSTVLFKALHEYKARNYRKIILIKNPTEAGDDTLGLLTGDKSTKLEAHMNTMKTIFHQFMDKPKLENDISNGNIVLDIPNYLLGATLNDSLIILEEAQTMSPDTLKLCMERAGVNTKVVVLGDSRQRYSVKKRPDGLRDLIERTTYDNYGARFSNSDMVGYVEMTSADNKRSELSRFIVDLYDDEDKVTPITAVNAR